ncbi:MAG: hypothetical protein ACI8YQ_003542 [Polaribacter sp.]|jgi:hypothetical protein
MLDLISIHIPKTGGTSFYQILQQVYGEELSISYRRKDYNEVIQRGLDLAKTINEEIKIFHGHLCYEELRTIHQNSNAKVICWLRDPVERVISNHRHFIKRNSLPNPVRPHQHRVNESLLNFAQRESNRNRMSQFLEGIDLQNLFFIGFLESFEKDLIHLSNLLEWPDFNIPKLNTSTSGEMGIPIDILLEIKDLNKIDYALYNSAQALAERRIER